MRGTRYCLWNNRSRPKDILRTHNTPKRSSQVEDQIKRANVQREAKESKKLTLRLQQSPKVTEGRRLATSREDPPDGED